MKTSNKILTTFLSIIALYFLVFALDLRLFGRHKNNGMFPELNKHIIPIEEFKYIKLDKISNLVISPASTDSYEIEIKYSTHTTHFDYLSESVSYTHLA
ncbi:MAG: hypothetical protein NWS46_09710, partial [Cyclobacteriaceae bacterium]|nr:hypothetical protein [Cyclobacteriaceae bacterium]